MEVVIPQRRSSARFAQTSVVSEDEESPRVSRIRNSWRSSLLSSPRRARQTVQWPYQTLSPVISKDDATLPKLPQPARRKTWQPRGAIDSDDEDGLISPVDIPDYVVNFLRGETPESIARRKHEKRRRSGAKALEDGHFGRPSTSDKSGQLSPPASADDEMHILPGIDEKLRQSSWRRLGGGGGWRRGIGLNGLSALIVLLVGLVCVIVLVTKSTEDASHGLYTVFDGSCTAASRIDWGLRALISILAIGLLAGGNYAFQVLSSPTRNEIAVAHSRRKWLDIGIPSIRNFLYISNERVFWSLLALFAVTTIQLIFNSIIVTSQGSTADFEVLVVTPSFLSGAPFSNASANNAASLDRIDILALQDLANRDQLVNISAAQCAQEFSAVFDPAFQAVLAVVGGAHPSDNSLVQTTTGSSTFNVTIDNLAFCLAQPEDAPICRVSGNASLLGLLIALTAISLTVLVRLLLIASFAPLVTLGDAIASFLREADSTTRGACLMNKHDVWRGHWGLQEAKHWMPESHYWFRTPSLPRWVLWSVQWVIAVVLVVATIALSTRADPNSKLSPFGTASPHAVYVLPEAIPASGAALIAAVPQLLVAALYLTTNSLVTIMFLSHESSLYALGTRRPLRVSSGAAGKQTTAVHLTLPRLWSAILLLLFMALSFTLTQAVFVVAVDSRNPTVSPDIAAIGFSGTALLILLALLVILAVLVLTLGFRRAPSVIMTSGQVVGNPLVLPGGSCSAVISARCHALPAERRDVWSREVMWGVVSEGSNGAEVLGHCAYTTKRAAQLDGARTYA